MGDRLATINMGQKLAAVPLLGGAWYFILTQRRLDRALPPYQVASWSIQPFGHNRHGPKIGGVPLWGAGSPCNAMWHGSRTTFVPSGILIHPAVWPQWTWAENWGTVPLFGGSWVLHLI